MEEKKYINVRISSVLRSRLDRALKKEGLDLSTFIISRVHDFVCEVEDRYPELREQQNDEQYDQK